MKLSELMVIGESQYRKRDGNGIAASNFKNSVWEFMQNFGEGAAVFVADKLVWFGDTGAARNEARNILAYGVERDAVRIRHVVPDTRIKGRTP